MAYTTSQPASKPAQPPTGQQITSEEIGHAILRASPWDKLDSAIEAQDWIDRIATPLQDIYFNALKPGPVGTLLRNVLNGSFLGHPLHSAVTDVPIGSWTATLVLDLISARRRDRKLDEAADITLRLGLAGSSASAITGFADWSYIRSPLRRLGFVHALTNFTVATLYISSLLARRAGNRRLGRGLSYAGYGLLMAGAFLGGELAYRFGIGVDHSAFTHAPSKWVDVQGVMTVGEGELHGGMADGMPVLVTRRNGALYAIGDTCTHLGCLLSKGALDGDVVTCYCHQSQFDVTTGQLLRGPADYPEPKLAVRETNGMIQVRKERARGDGAPKGGTQAHAKTTTTGTTGRTTSTMQQR
jgi:nitrite reductase/ring-hydroxylating ferredoxin subunit/uncharacterized membrane protein